MGVSHLHHLRVAAGLPGAGNATPAAVSEAAGKENPSAKVMLELALAKINAEKCDFAGACILLAEVKKLRPNDPFVTQQLALATYKNKQPNPEAALHEACNIIRELSSGDLQRPGDAGVSGGDPQAALGSH